MARQSGHRRARARGTLADRSELRQRLCLSKPWWHERDGSARFALALEPFFRSGPTFTMRTERASSASALRVRPMSRLRRLARFPKRRLVPNEFFLRPSNSPSRSYFLTSPRFVTTRQSLAPAIDRRLYHLALAGTFAVLAVLIDGAPGPRRIMSVKNSVASEKPPLRVSGALTEIPARPLDNAFDRYLTSPRAQFLSSGTY